MQAVRALKAGALYFAVVFAVGFTLGLVRELWVAPRLGARAAELLEAPVMLAAVVLAARWTVRRLAVPSTPSARLGTGLVALSLLLVAELTVVMGLRGLSVSEYVSGREPVSGTVYVVMLGVFAAMPWLLARR